MPSVEGDETRVSTEDEETRLSVDDDETRMADPPPVDGKSTGGLEPVSEPAEPIGPPPGIGPESFAESEDIHPEDDSALVAPAPEVTAAPPDVSGRPPSDSPGAASTTLADAGVPPPPESEPAPAPQPAPEPERCTEDSDPGAVRTDRPAESGTIPLFPDPHQTGVIPVVPADLIKATPGSGASDASSADDHAPRGTSSSGAALAEAPAPPPPTYQPVTFALSGHQIGVAALRGVLGYVAALVFAIIAIVVVVLSFSFSEISQDFSSSTGGETGPNGFGAAVAMVVMLVGAALGGPVGIHADAATANLFLMPLTITAVIATCIVVLYVVSYRQIARGVREDPAGGGSGRSLAGPGAAVEAGVTGLALGVLGAVVSAIARISDSGVTLGANPFLVFLGGLIVGASATVIGQFLAPVPWAQAARARIPAEVRGAVLGQFLAVIPVAAILTLLILIAGIREIGVGGTTTAVLAVLPNLLALVAAFASLGGIQLSGATGAAGEFASVGLFTSGVPGLAWLLVLVPVIGMLCAGVLTYVRSGGDRSWRFSWVAPVFWFVAVLLGMAVTGARLAGAVSIFGIGAGGAIALYIAPITLLTGALWGFGAEVVARTVAPYLAALLPPSVLGRIIPRTPPANAPGPASSPTPSPGQNALAATSSAAPAPEAGRVPSVPMSAGGAAAAADPSTGLGLPAWPIDRRKAVLVTSCVLAAIIVIIGAAVTRSILNDSVYSPKKPVQQYLTALANGNAEEAISLADPDVPNDQRGLLTNEVYSKAQGRPGNVEFTDIIKNGDVVTVRVRYDQDGAKVTQNFTVKKNGSAALFFDKWELVAPSVTSVPVTDLLDDDSAAIPEKVIVNGVPVSMPTQGDTPQLSVLPGKYTVSLPDQGEYFSASTGGFTVRGGGQGLATPVNSRAGYSYSKKALDEARASAEKWLAGCLASTSVDPEGCPFSDWKSGLLNVKWTLSTEPTCETSTSHGVIELRCSDGEVTLTGKEPEGVYYWGDGTYSQKHDLTFSSFYAVQDGKVVEIDPTGD